MANQRRQWLTEFHFHPPQSPQNERPVKPMNLNDEQRKQVAIWVAEGLKLSEIQSRLSSDLGVRLTYMEVRLLVDDLKLTPKDPEPSKPAEPVGDPVTAPQPESTATTTASIDAGDPSRTPSGCGGVSVVVDQLARPGAIVSGKVTFSDGQQAEWYLDQTGRLGVVARQQGYKPTASDVQQFQLALEREMAKLGF
jgi:hypothetical protein